MEPSTPGAGRIMPKPSKDELKMMSAPIEEIGTAVRANVVDVEPAGSVESCTVSTCMTGVDVFGKIGVPRSRLITEVPAAAWE